MIDMQMKILLYILADSHIWNCWLTCDKFHHLNKDSSDIDLFDFHSSDQWSLREILVINKREKTSSSPYLDYIYMKSCWIRQYIVQNSNTDWRVHIRFVHSHIECLNNQIFVSLAT